VRKRRTKESETARPISQEDLDSS